MKTNTVLGILIALACVGCFFGGIVAFSNAQDDLGATLILVSAILCFLYIAIHEFIDGSCGGGIAMVFVTLIFGCILVSSIQNRVQPQTTTRQLLSIDGPYLLADTNMNCSPISTEHTFYCIGYDVNRYTRCAGCGRRFLEHYPMVRSVKDWRSKIRHEKEQRDAWINYLDIY